jgi:hypothetical protein
MKTVAEFSLGMAITDLDNNPFKGINYLLKFFAVFGLHNMAVYMLTVV